MKTRSNSYWEKRASERMDNYHRKNDKVVKTITDAYNKAIADIEVEIQKLYDKFSIDGSLSPEDARKFLNSSISNKEMEDLRELINSVQDIDLKKYLLSRLNAKAYKARMTRLEALKERIYIECNKLADVEIKQSNSAHINTIKEAYHKAMFDLQKGLDLGFDFSQMPSKTMENILKNPWSGNHFSDRVWKNTEVLATKLTETLTSGMMSGKSVPKMVKEIEDLSEVGKHAANRLIRTETTYMANAAEMESYKEAEIDKYMFVATLDNRTSEICREHDLKVYDVSKAVPGENMPPLHPYCRSTTIAYLGEDTLKDIERRARDPETGKTYKVPAGMNYKEWQKEYVKEV